jgi:signal transduction histidine kinase
MSMSAPIPANERQRLRSLHSYKILDSRREAAYDDLTRIAAQICGTPMASVTLVDETRQWFKSTIGIDVSETSREVSFCAHAILQDGLFIVPDTHEDLRFVDNALVTGDPHLRFYAGAVLHSLDGNALGTLCVLDRVPRELDANQKAALEALARQAMAQMEMRRSLEEAERVMRYRSRLMAMMGHDLKQPVNVINMALTLIEDRLQGEEEETLGFAKSAIGKLSTELDVLAQASRLDQDSIQIGRFPIQSVLDSIFDNWNLRARRKGLNLDIASSDEIVESDERMVATILGNLIGNAIKYTEKGNVSVKTRRDGDAFVVEIVDTGIGFPEEQLGKIFESFTQLDSGRSEGLGLGLAIVQRTAELLGCEIGVASQVGQGSHFTVTIPSRWN